VSTESVVAALRKRRDKRARDAVLEFVAKAHDRFAEEEQMHVLLGNDTEAVGAKWYADVTLRAYRAEMREQEPIDTPPPYRYDARDRG
jgi:hypothetical protein